MMEERLKELETRVICGDYGPDGGAEVQELIDEVDRLKTALAAARKEPGGDRCAVCSKAIDPSGFFATAGSLFCSKACSDAGSQRALDNDPMWDWQNNKPREPVKQGRGVAV